MFKKDRGGMLYWALGIAGAVVMAAAGTGTWFYTRGRNKRTRDIATQAKRVITRTANKQRKAISAKSNAKNTNHAKTNHATNHHAHAR